MFRIGFNCTARMVEQMEFLGIANSPKHNDNRDVMFPF
ncbi:MAG: hypothetical protein ACTXOO_00735 [Sodalis sp. (in: enterobacteria)]